MSLLETIAKQEAKRWLSPYVLRGDPIEHTAYGMMGTSSRLFRAQIGNYAWYRGESIKLKSRQVAITRVGGIDCLYIFSLEALYHEILHPEETVAQLPMF